MTYNRNGSNQGSISNRLVTAKGDLVSATANAAPARLAVGNNGETLVADSSASTGLRWQAPVAVNPFINGGFDIWQRGTSVAFGTVGGFGADRNVIVRGGWASGATMSRQTGTAGIQYAARIQRDSGNTSTANTGFSQSLETANSIFYQGKTVTFSFYARAGANYSSASSVLRAVLATGTGTDQNLITAGYTGQVNAVDQYPVLTTSWQRFTYTATLASNANEIAYYFSYDPVGTAGANDWFEVTGIQLEVGSVATPFRRSGGTLAGELAACQRYYWRTTGQVYTPSGIGMTQTSTGSTLYVNHPVPMRVSPSTLEYSNLEVSDLYDYAKAVSNLVIESGSSGTNTTRVTATHTSGATAYRPAFLRNANNSAGYIGFSAEL